MLVAHTGLAHNYPSWTADLQSTAIIQTVHGFRVLCDACDYVGRHIIVEKDWEALMGRTIAACVQSGDVTIDIGANIGFHTMRMAQQVGETGRVIAFEPDLRNYSMLLETMRLNSARQILPLNMGLADREEILRMAPQSGVNYGLSNMRAATTSPAGQLALVMRGDQLPLLGEKETIALIKLDVEGLELEVLRGFREVLQRTRAVICEVSPAWVDTNAIFDLMAGAGFRFVAAPPVHADGWFHPETQRMAGQHDVLFYRELTPALAAIVR